LTHQERKFRKWVEEKRRWHERRAGREEQSSVGNCAEAQVSAVWGHECELIAGSHRRRARVRGHQAVPGDRVRYSERGVEGILPRRTTLARTDPARPSREQVLAANIDVVAVVGSFGEPPLRPGLFDRYLVAIQRGGAEPLLCVNKADLLTTAERGLLAPYEALGVPLLLCSAFTGSGLAELRARLEGRLCVFTGHSGVGKSSLLNALAPGLEQRTAALSEAGGKGRHTTTASSLHELGCGIRIIDTPGIREFGIGLAAPGEMIEFDAYAGQCRFRNCAHTHEPGCAVKDAVARGEIPRARYESYLKLLDL
jgi:ribosome biogenesis GTPase